MIAVSVLRPSLPNLSTGWWSCNLLGKEKFATFGLLAARCFAFSNFRLWPQRKKHPAIESRGDINMQAQAWGPSLRGLTLSSRRCQPDSTAFPGAYISKCNQEYFLLICICCQKELAHLGLLPFKFRSCSKSL